MKAVGYCTSAEKGGVGWMVVVRIQNVQGVSVLKFKRVLMAWEYFV
jgi:hypothetical protein